MDPLQFIREFGLPTMALVVTGYGIWQVCAWIAKELIVPPAGSPFCVFAVH